MRSRDRSIWAAIAWGGLIAGTIDIGAATLINLVSPIVILHAIASGVLGRASFTGGMPSAFLGLLLQWAAAGAPCARFASGPPRIAQAPRSPNRRH
jgi:hypothetical protein